MREPAAGKQRPKLLGDIREISESNGNDDAIGCDRFPVAQCRDERSLAVLHETEAVDAHIHGLDRFLHCEPIAIAQIEFQRQWLDACKNPSAKTACDFGYSADMIEQMLLGLVAYRVGKKVEYDAASGKITNAPEANEFLGRTYRKGWTLNG